MEYWELEANTKGVVKNFKVYGLSVKEAAEDYKEDGIHSYLRNELVNLSDVKDTLNATNKNQDKIKLKVEEIQRKAQKKSDEFGKKASMADGQSAASLILSIPGVGQLLSGVSGAAVGGSKVWEKCTDSRLTNNIPVKVVATAAGASVTGAAATLATVIAMPYFWYKVISSNTDAKTYGALQKEFENVASQMKHVAIHMKNIATCLDDIEVKLKLTERMEKKFIEELDEKKRKDMADRLICKATDLVEATEKYLDTVNQTQLI